MLDHAEKAQVRGKGVWALLETLPRCLQEALKGWKPSRHEPAGLAGRWRTIFQASMCSGSKSGLSREVSTWSRQPPFR